MVVKVKKILIVGILSLSLVLGGVTVSAMEFVDTAGCWASGATGEIFCD